MIICFNNNKGGVLKTTTVTNIAGVLALQGKKVLIVDCDSQANVSLSFKMNPDNFRTTIYDVLLGGVPPEDAITKVHENIDIIPANNDLIGFDFEVIGDIKNYPEPYYILRNSLEHLREKYDYILLDTPPSLSLMNGNVFAFADKVVIPYQPEPYSMRSLKNVINTIKLFRNEHNPNIEILGVVLTLVHPTANLHAQIIQDTNAFAQQNHIHIFETVIPRTVQFASAIGYDGLPATLLMNPNRHNKNEKGALYFELTEEIQNRIERRNKK